MDLIQQYSSDEDDFFDDDDDEWCQDIPLQAPSPKRARLDDEQIGGGPAVSSPLFQFNVRTGAMLRRWKNVVNKTRHTARLQQLREPEDGDHLGHEMTDAVRRTLLSAIESHPNLRGQDRIHFTMQANAFAQANNHCFQSTKFQVSEVREGGERLATYLQQLARQLNSSQSFSPGDDLSLDVTTILMPEQGSKLKRYDPTKAAVRGIVKKCRIKINNDNDEMCCARAIVTMRALADEKDNRFPTVSYRTLRSNSKTQKQIAQQLLGEAGDEGPCGLAELAKLQAVLPDYQIKVLKVGRPHMLVYVGPESSTNRRILLLLEDGYFDGCTSYAAFFNNAYYCHDCDRGYNTEDVAHHSCDGLWCRSCFSLDCAEFLQAKRALPQGEYPKPTLLCIECNRLFMGPVCLNKHAARERGKRSTCKNLKKCKDCCKTYEVKFGKNGRVQERHKCGWAECQVCEKRVDIYQHQCFIQSVKQEDDEPKTKKVPVAEVETRE